MRATELRSQTMESVCFVQTHSVTAATYACARTHTRTHAQQVPCRIGCAGGRDARTTTRRDRRPMRLIQYVHANGCHRSTAPPTDQRTQAARSSLASGTRIEFGRALTRPFRHAFDKAGTAWTRRHCRAVPAVALCTLSVRGWAPVSIWKQSPASRTDKQALAAAA